MIVMPGDAKVSTHQVGNPLGRPQMRGPTVGRSALEQQGFQFLLLLRGQAWLWPEMELGSQTVRLFRHAQPAVYRTLSDTVNSGNVLHKVALDYSLNGPTSPSFQFRSGSKGSTHMLLDAPAVEKSHWRRSCQ